MSEAGLQELFNSERGVYLDGRLQQAIRRVLDLQFKGVPPSFQITCGKCKKVIDTNEHDPVYISGHIDASVSPPVALARVWDFKDFICTTCRQMDAAGKDSSATTLRLPPDASTPAVGVSVAAGPPLGQGTTTATGPPATTPTARSALENSTAAAIAPTDVKNSPLGAETSGAVLVSVAVHQSCPAGSKGSPAIIIATTDGADPRTASGKAAVSANAGSGATEAVAEAPEVSSAPRQKAIEHSNVDAVALESAAALAVPEGDVAAGAVPSGSNGALQENDLQPQSTLQENDLQPQSALQENDLLPQPALQENDLQPQSALQENGLQLQQVSPSAAREGSARRGGMVLKQFAEARTGPVEGKTLASARVDVTYMLGYMLFLPVSGAIDPTSPDQSSAASALARFVLAGPEAAAAAAEHCADLLTAEEVSRLRNLDFSVTLTSKQTLSLTLLAIADWVLAPQALDFMDWAATPNGGHASVSSRASSGAGGLSVPPLGAQLRPWAFAVREHSDVRTYGTFLRPSLLCLGGRSQGNPPTSLLEVVTAPPLRYSLAREALGQKDRVLASLATVVPLQKQGGGLRIRVGWVLPLQRLAALLRRRNKRTDSGPWRVTTQQLIARLEELLMGDLTYNTINNMQRHEHQQHLRVGEGGGSASPAAAVTPLLPVEAFLRDLGVTAYQIQEMLLLEDVDANVGFCVECGQLGEMVACDTCVDSFCCRCLGVASAESLEDDWRCRYCSSVITGFGKAAAAPGVGKGGTAMPHVKVEPAISLDDDDGEDDDGAMAGPGGGSDVTPREGLAYSGMYDINVEEEKRMAGKMHVEMPVTTPTAAAARRVSRGSGREIANLGRVATLAAPQTGGKAAGNRPREIAAAQKQLPPARAAAGVVARKAAKLMQAAAPVPVEGQLFHRARRLSAPVGSNEIDIDELKVTKPGGSRGVVVPARGARRSGDSQDGPVQEVGRGVKRRARIANIKANEPEQRATSSRKRRSKVVLDSDDGGKVEAECLSEAADGIEGAIGAESLDIPDDILTAVAAAAVAMAAAQDDRAAAAAGLRIGLFHHHQQHAGAKAAVVARAAVADHNTAAPLTNNSDEDFESAASEPPMTSQPAIAVTSGSQPSKARGKGRGKARDQPANAFVAAGAPTPEIPGVDSAPEKTGAGRTAVKTTVEDAGEGAEQPLKDEDQADGEGDTGSELSYDTGADEAAAEGELVAVDETRLKERTGGREREDDDFMPSEGTEIDDDDEVEYEQGQGQGASDETDEVAEQDVVVARVTSRKRPRLRTQRVAAQAAASPSDSDGGEDSDVELVGEVKAREEQSLARGSGRRRGAWRRARAPSAGRNGRQATRGRGSSRGRRGRRGTKRQRLIDGGTSSSEEIRKMESSGSEGDKEYMPLKTRAGRGGRSGRPQQILFREQRLVLSGGDKAAAAALMMLNTGSGGGAADAIAVIGGGAAREPLTTQQLQQAVMPNQVDVSGGCSVAEALAERPPTARAGSGPKGAAPRNLPPILVPSSKHPADEFPAPAMQQSLAVATAKKSSARTALGVQTAAGPSREGNIFATAQSISGAAAAYTLLQRGQPPPQPHQISLPPLPSPVLHHSTQQEQPLRQRLPPLRQLNSADPEAAAEGLPNAVGASGHECRTSSPVAVEEAARQQPAAAAISSHPAVVPPPQSTTSHLLPVLFTAVPSLTQHELVDAGAKVFEMAAHQGVKQEVLGQWLEVLDDVGEMCVSNPRLQGTIKSYINGLLISTSSHTSEAVHLEVMMRTTIRLLRNATRD